MQVVTLNFTILLFWMLTIAPNIAFTEPDTPNKNFLQDPFPLSQFKKETELVGSSHSQSIEEIDLILETQVDKLILGDEFGLRKGKINYVGLQNLFNILDFAINVDVENKKAKGWFIKEIFDFSMNEPVNEYVPVVISAKGINYSVKQSKLIYKDDDIYIDADTIFKILEIEYNINISTLTLKLTPSTPLPIQNKLARKNRKKAKFRNSIAKLPLKYTSYGLLTTPFTDLQTRYITNNYDITNFSYSALGSGDFAFMTGNYYIQGDSKDSFKNFRLKLSKDSIKNNLLGPLKATQYSFGDINPNAGGGVGVAGQEVGVRITNKPSGSSLRLQKTDFIGDAQPGWDVELYRNNIFIDSVTISDNGRYEFYNQNLAYGKNNFKLIFYGPQGQQYEKIQVFDLNSEGFASSKIVYDMSLSKQQTQLFLVGNNSRKTETNKRRFNISLFNDVNEYISLQGSYSRYTFYDGVTHNFFKSGVRVFALNTLLSANAIKDINGGHTLTYSLSKSLWQQSLSYSNTTKSAGFSVEATILPTVSQTIQSASVAGSMLKTKYTYVNYDLRASRSVYENSSITNSLDFNSSVSILRLTLKNNLNYSESSTNGSVKKKYLSGIANLGTLVYGVTIRAGANYILEPVKRTKIKQVPRLFSSLSKLLTVKLRAKYSYGFSTINQNSSHTLALNWRAKKFTVTGNYRRNNNGNYTAFVGINFSLSYNKRTHFNISPERISRTGAISAHIFSDENNNGIYDSGEPVIQNAKIRATQAYKSAKTDENGLVFLPGLPTNRATDIELDIDSLEDPFLTPSKQGYSFVPRPGVTETVNIPLVTSGEVEGTIYLENKNGSNQVAGYVPLNLINIQTRHNLSTISAYDGFYLFTQVPPGKYLVEVDKLYLTNNKYNARKPMPRVVTIFSTGNIEMENDFSIYSLATDQ